MEIQISENEKTSSKKIIGTYVDSSIYDLLQKEANDNFMSLSSLIKKIIYQYIQGKESNTINK